MGKKEATKTVSDFRVDMEKERIATRFLLDVWSEMQKKNLTKTDLARRIGKSQAYITKVFRGSSNFTLETMARIGLAVFDEELIISRFPKPMILANDLHITLMPSQGAGKAGSFSEHIEKKGTERKQVGYEKCA